MSGTCLFIGAGSFTVAVMRSYGPEKFYRGQEGWESQGNLRANAGPRGLQRKWQCDKLGLRSIGLGTDLNEK